MGIRNKPEIRDQDISNIFKQIKKYVNVDKYGTLKTMTLPKIDIFNPPLDIWETREPTFEERLEHAKKNGNIFAPEVQVKLNTSIKNAVDAATYIGKNKADNTLGRFIKDHLDSCSNFKIWRKAMPTRIPKALKDYQSKMSKCNFKDVYKEIKDIKATLEDGQTLFHGGHWNFGNNLLTSRPLSTTLCPVVAFVETLHNGKAYDAGQIDLWVLKVVNPVTNVYVFNPNSNWGHEKEVLFNSGASLRLIKRTQVNNGMKVIKINPSTTAELSKIVPVNVLEVEIS